MEERDLSVIPDKGFCEEVFGGKMDVTEERDTCF